MTTETAPAAPVVESTAPVVEAPVAADSVDAAPATPPVEPAKTEAPPKSGTQFAILAKKEKALRENAEKLKTERAQLESQKTEYQKWLDAKAEAKRNPLKLLEANGITYDDVVEAVMGDGKPTPSLEVKAIRDELESFKKAQEEERTKTLEAEKQQLQAQQEAVVAEFEASCINFVEKNAETYELINLRGMQDQVAEVIKEHLQKQVQDGVPEPDRKLLSVEEAAQMVEKYLEEEQEKIILASKKLKAKVAPPSPEAAPQRVVTEPKFKSLNNKLSGSTANARPKGLSAAERERAAIEAYHAALK